MKEIARKIIQIILILLALYALGFLVYQNYAVSGHLTADYDFGKSNAYIGKLLPAGRTFAVERAGSDYFQRVKIDPVYFDVFMPTSFESAKITIYYKAPEGRIIKMGPQVREGFFYELKELKCGKKFEGWCYSTISINLDKVLHRDKKVKFMISSPGLDKSEQDIKITHIHLKLSKWATKSE